MYPFSRESRDKNPAKTKNIPKITDETSNFSSARQAEYRIIRSSTKHPGDTRYKSSHVARSPSTVMNDSMKRQCSIYVQCFYIHHHHRHHHRGPAVARSLTTHSVNYKSAPLCAYFFSPFRRRQTIS